MRRIGKCLSLSEELKRWFTRFPVYSLALGVYLYAETAWQSRPNPRGYLPLRGFVLFRPPQACPKLSASGPKIPPARGYKCSRRERVSQISVILFRPKNATYVERIKSKFPGVLSTIQCTAFRIFHRIFDVYSLSTDFHWLADSRLLTYNMIAQRLLFPLLTTTMKINTILSYHTMRLVGTRKLSIARAVCWVSDEWQPEFIAYEDEDQTNPKALATHKVMGHVSFNTLLLNAVA
eukprot:5290877-Pyramimonas_sp.AAC.1